MKKFLLIVAVALTSVFESAQAQNVNIPDANFKAALVANTNINTNSDTEIQVSEAVATTYMDVTSLSIADLTGIEAFTNLVILYCHYNSLTSLDVSACTDLTTLYCVFNQITSLDFSSNTLMYDLRCANNQLTSIDFRNGNNTNIWIFTADNNPNLTCIDVDDSTYSATNWPYLDATAHYSEDCSGTLGIIESSSLTELSVYPNPANETLNIVTEGTMNISIINMLGEEIYQATINSNFSIDISEFSAGVYFIKNLNNGQSLKFIKE